MIALLQCLADRFVDQLEFMGMTGEGLGRFILRFRGGFDRSAREASEESPIVATSTSRALWAQLRSVDPILLDMPPYTGISWHVTDQFLLELAR